MVARACFLATSRYKVAKMLPQAMVALLLLAVPAPALAMKWFDGTADLVYRSADKLGLGINLSMQKSPSEMYYFAPSMRLGLAIGGASLSAGCSLIASEVPTKAQFEIDVHVAAVQTFDASDWRSGSWVGPELSVNFFYVKLGVGRLQRLGQDRPARTQFAAGVVVPIP